MRSTLYAALALTLFAGAAEARQGTSAPMRQAGTLTCMVAPGLGMVVGSTRPASCTFVSNFGGFQQGYQGQLSRVGLDLGVTGGQTIAWRVYTAGGRSRSNMLNGLHAGPSSEATFVGGPGTQILVAGGERIAFEPVMHSGQAGFNLAIGTGSLDLRAASLAVVRR